MGQAHGLAVDHANGKLGWLSSAFRAPPQPARATIAAAPARQIEHVEEIVAPMPPAAKLTARTQAELAPARDKEAMLGQIRSNIAALRTSQQRVRDLEAGVAVMSERAKSEIGAANERAEAAEARAAVEAARADLAEQRWREAEAGMEEILQIIAGELNAPFPR